MDPSARLGHPPTTERDLLERAEHLATYTLGELADALQVRWPSDPTRAKGWTGALLERALGATAENRSVPDFERLGVELKTVPVDARGRPRESTFLTRVSWDELAHRDFGSSSLHHKTERVLWIPVEAVPDCPWASRRIGRPLPWSPDPGVRARMQADWDRFANAVRAGQVDRIDASWGELVQMRPKAADGRRRTRMRLSAEADRLPPRGFYFRARFTAGLFAAGYDPTEDDAS